MADSLPAFIRYLLNEEIAKKWTSTLGHQLIHDVEFEEDEKNGNWTGEWTTEEDKWCEIDDDDLEFEFDLSGIDLSGADSGPSDKRVYVNAEEASVNTMGTMWGEKPNSAQQKAVAGHASGGAASVEDGAGAM